MKKLSVPENISLRWELWPGFGRPEILATLVVTGIALVIMVAFCQISAWKSATMIAVVVLVTVVAACIGFFGKLENNQSIYDFLRRQALYRQEQQDFPYQKRKGAYCSDEEKRKH